MPGADGGNGSRLTSLRDSNYRRCPNYRDTVRQGTLSRKFRHDEMNENLIKWYRAFRSSGWLARHAFKLAKRMAVHSFDDTCKLLGEDDLAYLVKTSRL
jgi:hypothetical protein